MSHKTISRDRIAVVGAGPVGLLHAIVLLWFGVPCRVFEQASGPLGTSRACVMHAKSLELLALLGIADRFIRQGRRAFRFNYHFLGAGEIAQLDFTRLDGMFRYMLNISQGTIEQILREYLAELGGVIEWNTELQAVTTDGAGRITARVVNKVTGREETLHPEWLIGCDGLRSRVRDQMGIPFVGGEYHADQMRMTDAWLRGLVWAQQPGTAGLTLSEEDTHYLVDDDRMTLLINLPGPPYRLLVSDMSAVPEDEITSEAFQSVLDKHFRGAVTLGHQEWASNFTIRSRIAETYRRDGVFLVGDAGHIHSPAGAQGMNLGLADAFNLGWKLARVARGEAPEALLDTYEPERRPVAEQVIARTKKLHDLLMNHGTPVAERLEIIREPEFLQQAVNGISGIGTTYRQTAPTVPGLTALDGIAAGDRAPQAHLTPKEHVHKLLRHAGDTLLVFQGDARSASPLKALESRIARRFGERVHYRVITPPDLSAAAPSGAIVADSYAAHKLYGADKTDAMVFVRPDGHISWRCEMPSPELILPLLERPVLT
ncbi:FAD-dependent monooxygenase [Nocardia sp. NPDC052278]|uniref:FAD-dependent monooxygenase n=1 Tax=unclassified Nocardia TaxID=2637762 RepID=UPI0036B0CE5D